MKMAFISVFVNTIRLSTDRLIASAHALILSADTIRKMTANREVLQLEKGVKNARMMRTIRKFEQIPDFFDWEVSFL